MLFGQSHGLVQVNFLIIITHRFFAQITLQNFYECMVPKLNKRLNNLHQKSYKFLFHDYDDIISCLFFLANSSFPQGVHWLQAERTCWQPLFAHELWRAVQVTMIMMIMFMTMIIMRMMLMVMVIVSMVIITIMRFLKWW